MNIAELIKESHDNAVERGFYDCPNCSEPVEDDPLATTLLRQNCPVCNGSGIDPNKNIGELLMLIVSELGEALEAHRCGKVAGMDSYEYDTIQAGEEDTNKAFRNYIKDTFEDELADVFIRLFDLCGYLGIEPTKDQKCMDFSNWNTGEALCYITEQIVKLRGCEKNKFYYDVIIYCLLGFCQTHKIPIEKHIKAKMAYNRTRPHKHNKEY